MGYDFETPVDRRGTFALKWDNIAGDHPDPVPLWVADMDFAVAPEIGEALGQRLAHPIYGYTNLPPGYWQTVAGWYQRRYGRDWRPEHFLAAPSVLHGLSMAVRAFTAPGDRILNLPPVYYPFYKVIRLNGREVVDVPLRRRARWELDYSALETTLEACRAEGRPVRALLLSAPHNPTGRVWTEAELALLGDLAERYDFWIFSDEIHADLVAPGHLHRGPLDLPELAHRTLVFAGPNKTFNLAGLPLSHVVALDEGLRQRMRRAIEADFFDQPNVLSLTAAWAAYDRGEAWLDELIGVIARRKATLDRWLEDLNAAWGLTPPLRSEVLEATYLAWVDATGLIAATGYANDRDLAAALEAEQGVKLTPGSTFQTGGENHLRFNLALPEARLVEGLARIRAALEPRLAKG